MKSQALFIVRESPSPHQAYQKLREYLQHVILRVLFEQKALKDWVSHGGTALRIIHNLNRFSEDLDFHLNKVDPEYSLSSVIIKLRKALQYQGYSISDTLVKEKTVRTTFIKFDNLLFESGLTSHRDEKLSIKLEVDTNPPDGYQYESTLVNTYFPFGLIHHDVGSFLSGKIHALLQRPYTKGRDYYDLMFLLSRWKQISPNLEYLNNALKQSAWSGSRLRPNNWKEVLTRCIRQTNWQDVQKDVEPFLESSADVALLDKDLLLALVNGV